jgi:organic hydroperoxide reductase OsmC/OhrA
MKVLAAQAKHQLPAEATVTATVGSGPRDDGGLALSVGLAVHVPGMTRERLEALVKETDAVCPYSHAVRGNVAVEFNLD